MPRYNFYHTKRDDNSVVTYCVSRFAGRSVRGVAKCIATDNYDEKFGNDLAQARCDLKVAEKRVNRATYLLAKAQEEVMRATQRATEMAQYLSDATTEYIKYDALVTDLESKAE